MNDPQHAPDEWQLPLTPELAYEGFQPLSAVVKVEIAAQSHAGGRPTNEDQFLVVRIGRYQETVATSLPDGEVPARFDEEGYGMVVADGMGPAGSGETASRLAVSTLAHLALHFGKWNVRISPGIAEEVMARMQRFYRRVEETLTDKSIEEPDLSGMGTTMTAAVSAGDELFTAHVGHSRAYLYRNALLTQLTRDHTYAQRLLDVGRPAPTELAAHDLRHILTDAIGGHAGRAHIEIGHYRLKHDDCLLVCTNGLTDVVNNDAAAAILRQPSSVAERCKALVDDALARGAKDNVTAVLARYSIPASATRGL